MGAKTGSVGNKCNAWKGNEVSYSALHKWIVLKKGSPNYCEECKISSTPKGKGLIRSYFHWANISGHYKRIINDWKRLCIICHQKFDRKNRRWAKSTGRPRKS